MTKDNNSIIVSIHPDFVDLIFEGIKTVELRRSMPRNLGKHARMIIYATSPQKCVVGTATVEGIVEHSVEALWKKTGKQSGITYAYFKEYFKGCEVGYGILISSVTKFAKPIPLETLRRKINFTPPQSYMYGSEEFMKALA